MTIRSPSDCPAYTPRMELQWRSIYGMGSGAPDRDALYLGNYQVARMNQRLDGSWYATLHHPTKGNGDRECTNSESGRRGCEVWAERHREALQAKGAAKDREMIARQPWRGAESRDARQSQP